MGHVLHRPASLHSKIHCSVSWSRAFKQCQHLPFRKKFRLFISLATNNMLIPNSFPKYHMVAQPWNYVSLNTPHVLLNWAQLARSVTTKNRKRWARDLFRKMAPNDQRRQRFLQKNAGYDAPWWYKFGYPRLWKQPTLVVQLGFFTISLHPSHWVINETGGRGWNIMLGCGLEVYREYM